MAPGKGGHYLKPFLVPRYLQVRVGITWRRLGPITHRFSTPVTRERDPPHTNTGPAGYRDCYAFEGPLKVEVILAVYNQKREIVDPRGFKSTQFLLR